MLLALAGVTSRFKRLLAKFKKFAGLIQVFALLLLLLSFALLSNKGSYPMPGVVLPVLASAVLLGFGAGTPLAVLAQSNGLQALGAVSYSLYLYHWPCIVFARYLFGSQSGFWLPVALLATALLTWFSYRFVELGWSRSASLARLGLLGGFGLVGLALFDSQAQRLREAACAWQERQRSVALQPVTVLLTPARPEPGQPVPDGHYRPAPRDVRSSRRSRTWAGSWCRACLRSAAHPNTGPPAACPKRFQGPPSRDHRGCSWPR